MLHLDKHLKHCLTWWRHTLIYLRRKKSPFNPRLLQEDLITKKLFNKGTCNQNVGKVWTILPHPLIEKFYSGVKYWKQFQLQWKQQSLKSARFEINCKYVTEKNKLVKETKIRIISTQFTQGNWRIIESKKFCENINDIRQLTLPELQTAFLLRYGRLIQKRKLTRSSQVKKRAKGPLMSITLYLFWLRSNYKHK